MAFWLIRSLFTKEVNTSLYKNFIQEQSPEVIENADWNANPDQ